MLPGKVYIVNQESRAQYKVCFVDNTFREKNAEIIKGCKLVKMESQADVKVFLTTQESRADILITRKNFPSA